MDSLDWGLDHERPPAGWSAQRQYHGLMGLWVGSAREANMCSLQYVFNPGSFQLVQEMRQDEMDHKDIIRNLI